MFCSGKCKINSWRSGNWFIHHRNSSCSTILWLQVNSSGKAYANNLQTLTLSVSGVKKLSILNLVTVGILNLGELQVCRWYISKIAAESTKKLHQSCKSSFKERFLVFSVKIWGRGYELVLDCRSCMYQQLLGFYEFHKLL